MLGDVLTEERMRRYPIALLAVTVLIYLVNIAGSKHLIEPNGEIIGRDYLAFYMAGDMASRGRWDQLYSLQAQAVYQNTFMEDINPGWASTCLYLNPPHYAWAMSLMTRLGYGKSLVLWWLLSLACFAASAMIWRRWLKPGAGGLVLMLAVCMPAWFQVLAGGQNTFISLLIMTAFCGLLMKGRDGWAGIVLSLLAFKFQLLIVPAGWLLLTGRWRALRGLVLGGAMTLVATVVTCGPEVLADYLRFATQLDDVMLRDGFAVYKQHSWYGFFYLIGRGWLPLSSIQILTVTASTVTLVFVAGACRGVCRPDSPAFLLMLSSMMVGLIATCPHMFHYDMFLAVLPAVLWLRAARDPEIARATSVLKLILALGFVWLAVSGSLARVTHFQLSPLLMLIWLIVHWRTFRSLQRNLHPCSDLSGRVIQGRQPV